MNPLETRRVFVTKYALTQGFWTELCGLHIRKTSRGPIRYWRGLDKTPALYKEGTDVFLSEAEARADIQNQAQTKIANLEKALVIAREMYATGYETLPLGEKGAPSP